MEEAPDFNIQPVLENEKVELLPLKSDDFDELYQVASDPLIWEQHPNKNRWQLEVFKTFFEGAMQSKGAFKVVEKVSGKTAGCTRIYDYSREKDQALIGYTFYGREFWGTGLNLSAKRLLLDYLFQFVSKIHFHIGAENTRSQVAIGRLGAKKVGEVEVAYYGEPIKLNFIYEIRKLDGMI
ncbi:MAG: GNAT family N-acetyltransferase [Saprospiraceae bacterium]|nr:GNAT family N-acetyltransferase [Saprospiraceae bacterium]